MQINSLIQARFALWVTLLALVVILLGAYVRLSDAGLGCPDWPGCYGKLIVPSSEAEIASANTIYPHRPLETDKAWKEMVHRYLASTLGLCILALAVIALRRRDQAGQPLLVPWTLALLVALQGALGMWTVTLQVKPIIVTAHLLGGLATIALLWILTLKLYSPSINPYVIYHNRRLLWLSRFGVVILLMQILLGGWTSTNYAAIGCTDFPTCHSGQWWPTLAMKEAFTLWHGTDINFEYGILSAEARTTIHMMHRLGALATALYLSILCITLYRIGRATITHKMAWVIGLLLSLQVGLGITNVLGHLPLPIAVAHNGVAALLLLTLLTLNWQLKRAYTMG
ncbi:COX15/CtaA family protein [Sedimenticola selenatireducens]|uniref:Heme A synthase n=1 Tax=Sedimenticola selenatireducens TaxID=191960 RepID=A0A557SK65_9GAMM|nr:COX15/CtaA family protein [Sedimenticola selenatireducens]TVO77682.1 heme A synthase [Sedimenticola selenatireducens]TVT64988.1 MAG: heme A synthase [Sedimenticola selenatireducens]